MTASSSVTVEALLHADTVHALLRLSENTFKQGAPQFTKAQARRFFGMWLDQFAMAMEEEVLQRVAQILVYYLKQPKPVLLQVMIDLTRHLHDALTGDLSLKTRQTILSLCELWWKQDFPQKEQFIANALPYWLESPEDAAAVQKLYELKDALDCIDFAADESLRAAVLSLVSNPLVLKTGKKLLVHLLQNRDLIEPLHQAIKVQLVGNKTKIVNVYADVYYKAYHETKDPELQDALEHIVWSDFVQAVLHAADPDTHKAVRMVLQPLHAAQKHYEALLHRLYGPILWRALSAPQTQVRLQAAQILPEVFPLRGEHSSALAAVEQCVTALTGLLEDRVPKVRVAGASATAQVLCDYWTILPLASIRMLLNWLVTKHASDTSSASVRVGALNAVSLVLQNPQSHAVLRPLLPSLGNLLHDKTESVRLATVRMLLCVKETSDLAYYHVVPVYHLNARLANEVVNSSVAAALTSLLMSSYFPPDPATQIARTLHFLQTDPQAAATFYANVHRFLDTAQVAALAAMLWQTVLTAVETEKNHQNKLQSSDPSGKRRKKAAAKDDNENNAKGEEDDEDFFSSADAALMVTLTDTINVLWGSIAKDLHEDVVSFLVDHMEDWSETLQHFETNPDNRLVVQNILKIVRRLPSCDDLKINAENLNVAGYLSVYCHWGRSDEVISCLAKSLETNLGVEEEILFSTPEAKTKKRKSRRGKQGESIESLPASVALKVVHELLQDPDIRHYLLSPVLEKALEKGTKLAEKMLSRDRMIGESDIDFVLRVCEIYGRFVLHQAAARDEPNLIMTPQAVNLLRWMSVKVIPMLKDVDTDQSCAESSIPFNDPDLSTIAVEQSFADWPASPTPAGPPRRRRDTKATPNRVEVEKRSSLSPDIPRALAISLVQLTCVVFAEWLAISGGVGGSIIDSQLSEWFSAVSDDTTVIAVMSKLAFQLVRTSDQYLLFEQIMRKGPESNGLVRKLVSTLSSPLSKCQHKTIEVVFETAKAMYDPLKDEQYHSSWDEMWTQSSSAISAAVSAVVANRVSVNVLIDLATKTPSNPFSKQLLFLLHDRVTERSSDFTVQPEDVVA
ncbi:condensin-2 complex subunit G2 [Fistulifera solaris]|uniref:Condensin-2 complex subunit G2 n=1 Tax=Fistulifera solaris TaxID=1519565 RepID=A0A1Z5KKG0_FISSO|nr:condensin-2 complex subunit G2 [Fistulifera solaris]|eukprot:GAX26769.1 condensin-2 complex subunit G2 [Fistulifera solaris]